MRLTRQSVDALALPSGKPYQIVWDDTLTGFGVRVNPTNKQWVVQYRTGGKSRRETIGRVGTLSIEQARELARASLARAQLGHDPQAQKAEARARAKVTFLAVAERYLKHAQARLKARSYEEVERHLRKHWAPLADLPVDRVDRALISSRLDELVTSSGPTAANRARAALSALFSWAMATGLVLANPVVGTLRPAEEASRDRVLTDAELSAIWLACREDDHGRIVRLLMLTGQRRDEVADMQWSELNLEQGLWTIPASRTKNGRLHEVPLSAAAIDILRSVPRREGREYVFGEGAGGFSGWSKSKERLDQRIGRSGVKVGSWRLHDLRRTAATRLAEMGILPHVIEALLNHVSGHKAGVAGVYNRATYREEKQSSLVAWAEHITSLVRRNRENQI